MSEAQARRKITLEASVPFEFVVGNQTFPAGTYVFEVATGSPALTDRAGVLVVRNHQRRLYAAVAVEVTADPAPHVAPMLLFQKNGERRYLSKVWRQGKCRGIECPSGFRRASRRDVQARGDTSKRIDVERVSGEAIIPNPTETLIASPE